MLAGLGDRHAKFLTPQRLYPGLFAKEQKDTKKRTLEERDAMLAASLRAFLGR